MARTGKIVAVVPRDPIQAWEEGPRLPAMLGHVVVGFALRQEAVHRRLQCFLLLGLDPRTFSSGTTVVFYCKIIVLSGRGESQVRQTLLVVVLLMDKTKMTSSFVSLVSFPSSF